MLASIPLFDEAPRNKGLRYDRAASWCMIEAGFLIQAAMFEKARASTTLNGEPFSSRQRHDTSVATRIPSLRNPYCREPTDMRDRHNCYGQQNATGLPV